MRDQEEQPALDMSVHTLGRRSAEAASAEARRRVGLKRRPTLAGGRSAS